jgi:hypothetical protein
MARWECTPDQPGDRPWVSIARDAGARARICVGPWLGARATSLGIAGAGLGRVVDGAPRGARSRAWRALPSTVEALPAQRLARDEGVQPVGLDPDGRGLALAGRTAPLRRASVEREFGRLKNEWAMAPLRVRRVERVRLHVDLTILAKLATRLASERAVALAA